jgi:hypothetical protein
MARLTHTWLLHPCRSLQRERSGLADEGKGAMSLRDHAKRFRSCQTEAEQRFWDYLHAQRFKGLKAKSRESLECFLVDLIGPRAPVHRRPPYFSSRTFQYEHSSAIHEFRLVPIYWIPSDGCRAWPCGLRGAKRRVPHAASVGSKKARKMGGILSRRFLKPRSPKTRRACPAAGCGCLPLRRTSSPTVSLSTEAISVKKVTSLLVFSPACCVAQRVT